MSDRRNMKRIFLEKLLENKHFFLDLLEIDNRIMKSNYRAEIVESYIVSLLEKDDFSNSIISVNSKSLILSTGDIFQVLYFLSHVDPTTDFLFFPNYSFMGMNTLFFKVYNLVYGNCCYLIQDKNYNYYLGISETFNSVYIFGDEIVYQEMQRDFPNAEWISV